MGNEHSSNHPRNSCPTLSPPDFSNRRRPSDAVAEVNLQGSTTPKVPGFTLNLLFVPSWLIEYVYATTTTVLYDLGISLIQL